jgi:Asp/Glu/hydantoin racemase
VPRILVINPNSSTAVTAALDRGLDPLRWPGGPIILATTVAEGPPGIETQAQVDAASAHVTAAIAREPADAYVIACFSDPGLHAARERTRVPVFGIAESACAFAITLGARFGILSILDRSIPRHLRYLDMLGLRRRLAGDRAINIGVAGLGDEARTWSRLLDVGAQLRDVDGANALILGCAGMARYRPRLEQSLGIPVVDPTQAAVAHALAAVALGWRTPMPSPAGGGTRFGAEE